METHKKEAERKKMTMKRFIDFANWDFNNQEFQEELKRLKQRTGKSQSGLQPAIFFNRLVKEYQKFEDLHVISEGYLLFMNYVHYDLNRELFLPEVRQDVQRFDAVQEKANGGLVDHLTNGTPIEISLFDYLRSESR